MYVNVTTNLLNTHVYLLYIYSLFVSLSECTYMNTNGHGCMNETTKSVDWTTKTISHGEGAGGRK